MCATCGCLASGAPAPEAGKYKCLECEKAGKPQQVTVRKAEPMPTCAVHEGGKCHWVKV